MEQRWRDGLARRNARKRRDGQYWADLIEQLERIEVRFHLLAPKQRVSNHEECHRISREEAKALAAGLPYPLLIEKPAPRAPRALNGPPPVIGPREPSPFWNELAALARELRA